MYFKSNLEHHEERLPLLGLQGAVRKLLEEQRGRQESVGHGILQRHRLRPPQHLGAHRVVVDQLQEVWLWKKNMINFVITGIPASSDTLFSNLQGWGSYFCKGTQLQLQLLLGEEL